MQLKLWLISFVSNHINSAHLLIQPLIVERKNNTKTKSETWQREDQYKLSSRLRLHLRLFQGAKQHWKTGECLETNWNECILFRTIDGDYEYENFHGASFWQREMCKCARAVNCDMAAFMSERSVYWLKENVK